MRILLVNKFAHVTGGADQHCLGLVAALRERHHTVALLSTASPQNVERSGAFVPCSVTQWSRDGTGIVQKARVGITAVWNCAAAHAAKELITEFEPDLVHVHKLYPQLSVAPVVVAAQAGIPIVQTVHDYELIAANPLDELGGRIDTRESRLAFRALNSATFVIRRFAQLPRLARVIVPSRYLAGLYGTRGVATQVLSNFTELAGAATSEREGREGIAFVGRLQPEKGVRDVFELARRLPSTPVTIAGGGALEPEVRDEARRLPNLEYAGRLDRRGVARLLGSCRVAVMPSHALEAGPLVALEAMALGTPVVAYTGGGLSEYVSDAGGRVVPRDIDSLTRACAEVSEDHDLWLELSSRARAAVARSHSRTAYVTRLERVYVEAVACAS
jgi:glycosyltransferase involved in cell wall biosynthesis